MTTSPKGPPRAAPFLAAAIAALVAAGCAVEMDTERPASPIGHVVRDCVVPLPDRGAPTALEYGDGSLWIFDDGTGVFVASADAACAGDVDTWPAPVLALTAAEDQQNQQRTDGKRLAVHPRGGFVDAAGTAWLYYDLDLDGPGFFDQERLSTGVCPIAGRPGTCARGADDALWSDAHRPWGTGALLAPDGDAYLIGCDHPAAFTDLCSVARVAPGAAADPTAYQYLGFGDWEAGDRDTATVFEAPAAVSLSWHAPSARYLATVADIWGSRLELRSAPAPDGPWSRAVVLFDAVSPSDFFFAGGREHAGLRSADGKALAFTYATTNPAAAGLHLITFTLDDAGEVLP